MSATTETPAAKPTSLSVSPSTSTPKIAIVGEYWTPDDERNRRPFTGLAGWTLDKILEEVGIHKTECFFTSVFSICPPSGGDIDFFLGPKSTAVGGHGPLRSGKYVQQSFATELSRLDRELRDLSPNIIVCMGGLAAWAICGDGRVSKVRGNISHSCYGKALITYSPTAIIREWSVRPVVVADLQKVRRQAAFPDVVRPRREIWIEPSLTDLEAFYDRYLVSAGTISFDIETSGDQITCIGFAPSHDVALVVPFTDPRQPTFSYWPNTRDELAAWAFVKRVLALPSRKVTQNGLYDVHFLWRRYGIPVTNWTEDTMLLHHSMFPELQKGLDFLGSIYTDELSWKLMRGKVTTIKRDE